MKVKTEKIEHQKKLIDQAISELKKIWNESDTTLRDMMIIDDYAHLLDITDFSKTITGR